MALLGRGKRDEQKRSEAEPWEERVERVASDEEQREEQRETDSAAAAQARADHAASIPRWEYQVKRVGQDKQKGMLGSQRMEQLFNAEGTEGWELVAISEERATFKRPLPPRR